MATTFSQQYRPVTGAELYTDGRALPVRAVRDLIRNANNYHGRTAPRLLVYDLEFPLQTIAGADEQYIGEWWPQTPTGIGNAAFTTIEWKLWARLVDVTVTTTVRLYSHVGPHYVGPAAPFDTGYLSDQRAVGSVVVNSITAQWWQGTTSLVPNGADGTSLVLTFDDAVGPTAGIVWGVFAAWLAPLADV